MKKYFYRFFIELTNHKLLSVLLMKFSQSKISKWIIPSYSKQYKLNWQEVEQKQGDFETLHHLFTRKLKHGSREINEEIDSVVSPVDAVYEESGIIDQDEKITVKGKIYSIKEMLGDNEVLQKYIGGYYILLYLSPSHYHRIHSPISGRVVKRWSLGKNSYPVNKLGMKYGKAPLSKNFRVISEMEHEKGSIAVVKVGAMFVNCIEITNSSDMLHKGEEFAYFSFGSTVVLLFEKDTFEPNPNLKEHSEIKYGELLGYVR
ncbi:MULTISPECIES: phosphatidylserine decarboxylase [Bacillus]|uniref:phosphatidylserine decarboxylase n=1 Tax=Bacillus TaxID=1386 RepID=UPI0002D5F7A2|nr:MULTISPECIES: phosphatidylserine decarboxylase [Bacillus]